MFYIIRLTSGYFSIRIHEYFFPILGRKKITDICLDFKSQIWQMSQRQFIHLKSILKLFSLVHYQGHASETN
jgi:hypothetical protein